MKEQTERLGVAALDMFFSRNGWLFREQVIHDYGIDAHVEITNDSYPTGELIAIQIKSGLSFFKDETEDAYIFRTEDKHINYWANHTLPVIIALYHPDLNKVFWEVVNKNTIIDTGKNWKILVPKHNDCGVSCLQQLSQLTQPEPYIQRLNRLKLDRGWIEKVSNGENVFVKFEDWVNKSLPRYHFRLVCDGETYDWPMTYGPGFTIEAALEHFLPWANAEVDEDDDDDEYEEDGEIWITEGYSHIDEDTGEEIFVEQSHRPSGIVPISNDGEVDYYSLRLILNDLGRSFLLMDGYLRHDSNIEKRTFTIDQINW
jgi:hypothetical protein